MKIKPKKLILLTVLILLSASVTGCGVIEQIKDKFRDKANEATAKSIDDKIDEALAIGVSPETKAIIDELRELSDKLQNQESGYNPIKALLDDSYCMPWNRDKQNAELNKRIDELEKDFEKALESDSVYKKNKQKKQLNALKKIVPFVVILIVLLVLLILLKYLRKARKPKVPVVQSVPNAEHTGLLNDNGYMENQLKQLCSDNGLDYTKVIAKFGSDKESQTRAYMKLSSAIKRGDSEELEDLRT